MADTVAPPLPDGSIDFNVVHLAASKGQALDKAVEKATFQHPALPKRDAAHKSADTQPAAAE